MEEGVLAIMKALCLRILARCFEKDRRERWRKSKIGKKRKTEKVEPLGEREERKGEDDRVDGIKRRINRRER
jgi:hypothetical protein